MFIARTSNCLESPALPQLTNTYHTAALAALVLPLFSSQTPFISPLTITGVVYTFDFYQHLYNAVTFELDLGFRKVKLADYLNHQPAQVRAVLTAAPFEGCF